MRQSEIDKLVLRYGEGLWKSLKVEIHMARGDRIKVERFLKQVAEEFGEPKTMRVVAQEFLEREHRNRNVILEGDCVKLATGYERSRGIKQGSRLLAEIGKSQIDQEFLSDEELVAFLKTALERNQKITIFGLRTVEEKAAEDLPTVKIFRKRKIST